MDSLWTRQVSERSRVPCRVLLRQAHRLPRQQAGCEGRVRYPREEKLSRAIDAPADHITQTTAAYMALVEHGDGVSVLSSPLALKVPMG
jgi:hypothetical protein